jgi:hypothetical protein
MHVGLSSVIRVNRRAATSAPIGSLSNVIRFTFFAAPASRPRPTSRAAPWA